jgi:zinc transport system substrate-binding protein
MVTEGITSPELIVRPGASPHGYAMKPSEAQALDSADVVFWVGEALEPWMEKAVTTLASDAVVVELAGIKGVEHLAFREGGVWEGHDHGDDEHDEHGHDEAGHDDHGHDEKAHDDHAHGDEGHDDHGHDEAGHDDHGHDEKAHDDHGHDHGGDFDPHLWLSPDNALAWLDVIAETLAERDPEHADAYRKNAETAIAEIQAVSAEVEGLLEPLNETPYVVFHDAYQYFEHRFDLDPLGSIRLGDADQPGPARIIEIKEAISDRGAVCVFAEPQFEPRLIDTVIEGTNVRKGTLDPLGAELEPGADLYPSLIRGLAKSLVECLG